MNYQEYQKKVEKHKKDLAPVVSETIRLSNDTIFPQHILWDKEVCDLLENDKAKTVRIKGAFYFTEELVNRLMLFAYLRGSKDIELKSHKKGWDDCMADVAEKLNLYMDTDRES